MRPNQNSKTKRMLISFKRKERGWGSPTLTAEKVDLGLISPVSALNYLSKTYASKNLAKDESTEKYMIFAL
ncbi:unnamed protein product [Dovyalis caffra]|uniref:Uncharacterized protein n=1 Tax=Dovyalis caffra TaxID=77055 RepID=A0AAV1RFI0_9ROSI|nr:unnamed protein product [Dovyalis caffra]